MLRRICQVNWLGLLVFLSMSLPVAIASEMPVLAQNTRLQYSPPSGVGRPNSSLAGATRGCKLGEKDCPIAILPGLFVPDSMLPAGKLQLNHYPTTLAERPALFFYTPEFKGKLRFRLYKEAKPNTTGTGNAPEYVRIYQNEFPADIPAGIRRFSWPLDAPPLELNTNYKWDITLSNLELSDVLEGAIRRIPTLPTLTQSINSSKTPLEKAAIYSQAGIWFETLETLANSQCPQKNLDTQAAMANLLQSVNLNAIADQPIGVCCQNP